MTGDSGDSNQQPPQLETRTSMAADEAQSEMTELIRKIRSSHLTYLSEERLTRIARTCTEVERKGIGGVFIEAGCALGGSTILISRAKRQERRFEVYDLFEMIPPPGERDGPEAHERYAVISAGRSSGIGADRYYGYETDLLAKVIGSLDAFGVDLEKSTVNLIRGLLQETLRVSGPVAFAHIDVDWYEHVMTCLESIVPSLVVGGSIILDDYHDWSGCREAANEFFSRTTGMFDIDDSSGERHFTRRL